MRRATSLAAVLHECDREGEKVPPPIGGRLGRAAAHQRKGDAVRMAKFSSQNTARRSPGLPPPKGSSRTSGQEPWRSDGSLGGTFLLKNIVAGSGSSNSAGFVDANGTAFFVVVFPPPLQVELWKSNGWPAGTVKVADSIYPGGSTMRQAGSGTRVAFSRKHPTRGYELWQTDGSTPGTFVADLWPGFDGSNPERFTTVGNKLFFTADNGTSGEELFVAPLKAVCATLTHPSLTRRMRRVPRSTTCRRHPCRTDRRSGGGSAP